MNPRLSESASPYLRAHAGNPVEWWAWGEDAFAEARRRDVPVLVSIGYSTCHWCHVMARESFADAETAALVNAGFVAIKVDREEHPDVDSAYMTAAAAFTPHLGWPLTIFTTPDGGPFYAGTYFPPEPRAGMPSFRQVLAAVRDAWTDRREAAEGTAAAIAEALSPALAEPVEGSTLPAQTPTSIDLVAAARTVASREDREFGGFGGGDPAAPKFPVATALRLLQARIVRDAESAASAVASRALAAMAASPLHDTVEGGFFRYATRRDWTVPHYEKMLVDNAQLLDVATDERDAATARGIAGYLLRVLQRPGGGFAAAQDSESWIDGVRSEGGYYARDAAARALLEPPAVDGKVVTGWNGLAIGALARAGSRWAEPSWIAAAERAAEAVLARNVDAQARLMRASLDGMPSPSPATIADHGQLAEGLVALALATGDPGHAVRARELVSACIAADGGLAAPGGTDPVLAASGLTPPDAAADADEPSGAAAIAGAAAAMWLLGERLLGEGLQGEGLLGDDAMRALAARIVATHASAALAQPFAHGALLRVAGLLAHAPRQLVVVTEDRDDPDEPLVAAARGIRADVVAVVTPAQAEEWTRAGFGLFEGKTQQGARSTAYDCRAFACRLPVTRAEELEP